MSKNSGAVEKKAGKKPQTARAAADNRGGRGKTKKGWAVVMLALGYVAAGGLNVVGGEPMGCAINHYVIAPSRARATASKIANEALSVASVLRFGPLEQAERGWMPVLLPPTPAWDALYSQPGLQPFDDTTAAILLGAHDALVRYGDRAERIGTIRFSEESATELRQKIDDLEQADHDVVAKAIWSAYALHRHYKTYLPEIEHPKKGGPEDTVPAYIEISYVSAGWRLDPIRLNLSLAPPYNSMNRASAIVQFASYWPMTCDKTFGNGPALVWCDATVTTKQAVPTWPYADEYRNARASRAHS